MDPKMAAGIDEHFSEIQDPRLERSRLHKLIDILVIAICAVICGADTWEDIEAFGKAKQSWFAGFLELPNGIASHNTFNRVFNRLDPEQFQRCFVQWINAVSELIQGQVIAIDGKLLTCSRDKGIGNAAIDMVSAWTNSNHLVLGQIKVSDKSNEITAIPQLLEALEISGCIVTIDAIGCQTEMAETIIEQDVDYALLEGKPGPLVRRCKTAVW